MTRHRGFTLLELLVASAILAFALVGVMQVVTQGINVSRLTRARTQGRELAEQKLAELLQDPELEPGSDEGDLGELYPGHRWTSEVTETDLEGLYRVKVTVLWLVGEREEAVDIETCVAPGVIDNGSGQLAAATAETGP